MLSLQQINQVKPLLIKTCESKEKSLEFEIMFNNYKSNNKLPFVKFIDLLYFIKYRANNNKFKIINETTLDISYNYIDNNVYRITLNGIEKINSILNTVHQRKNHIIFSILCSRFHDDKDITFMNKQKEFGNIIDIDDYDLRFRTSNEIKISGKDLSNIASNIQYTDADKILFRFKNRISLIINDDEELGLLRLDLTFIKSSNIIDILQESNKTFEVELEYKPGKSKDYEKILNLLNNEIKIIKQVLENSEEIINKNESNEIIKRYKKLLFNSEVDNLSNLYTMPVTSTEIVHIIDKIPNKYAVTDKADGDKYQLFIINNTIYLISINMIVKKTKYTISNLEDTLFEGEYIYNSNKNIYIFMIFDCLYYKGINIRNELLLKNRLKYIYDFTNLFNPNYYIKSFDEEFDIINQEKYYMAELTKYYDRLNEIIKKSKSNDIIFYPKNFLFPTGGNSCEVYSFSDLLWSNCTSGKFKCPYNLDGIIFTGIEQKYTKDKREQKHIIYKYKPPNENSIDVYLTFQKNIETNKYLEVYDNSINGIAVNSIFRIANFFVGDMISNKEIPVPFMKEHNNHEAFLLLENEEIRDLKGRIVNNETVVEIIYINNPSIPHNYRWKILRTRWDKTESVIRDKKRYGNYKEHAIRIWNSIIESVTIDEIKKLARPETYIQQQKLLMEKIDNKVIISEKAQDKYYQKISNLGKIFREFHNWIKTIIYLSYLSPDPTDSKRKSILDISCSKAKDIMKMYHSRIGEYVGIDNDFDGLFGAIDSARSRYLKNVKKFPDFIKSVKFILADATIPFESKIQEQKIPNMTIDNKKLIDSTFTKGKKFDIINCTFALHYQFDTIDSIYNLINTVKTYLVKDGYMLCTIIDPNQLLKLLGNKNIFTSMYTDEDGVRQKFFEIIKKFNIENNYYKDEPGQAVDFYMSWMHNEGTYATEYIVSPSYLINIMKQADCALIDTDLFVNLYNINKEWFSKVIEHESNEKNYEFYQKVAKFYGELKGADKESLIWNELWRYYIFKKIS
jgi:hypothetical protein